MVISASSSPLASLPEAWSGATAAAEKVNAEGGIQGRPLEVLECDSEVDPNKQTACLQEAIKEKVVALVGGYIWYPGGIEVLANAGIPYIGGIGITTDDFTNTDSFPISGTNAEAYGVAAIMAANHVKKAGTINIGTENSSLVTEKIGEGLELAGLPGLATELTAEPNLPDYSAVVAALKKVNPEAISIAGPVPDTAKIITTLRESGYEGLIVQLAGTLSPSSLKAMGSAAEGVLVPSVVMPLAATEVPAVGEFLDEMKTYAPSAALTYFSETNWGSTKVFSKVLEGIKGEIDAESVKAAAEAATTPVEVGLIGPWVGSGNPPIASAPREFSYQVVKSMIKGGEVVPDGPAEFTEVIEELKAGK